MMPSKLPKCRLSAVGSKPQYSVSVSDPAAFSKASLVVSCAQPGSLSDVVHCMRHALGVFRVRSVVTCIKPLARRSWITFSEDASVLDGLVAALAAFAAQHFRRLARLICRGGLLSRLV